MKDLADYTWSLEDASLKPKGDDRWIWLVRFEARPTDLSILPQGPGTHLQLLVLMDGRVVNPTVKDYPLRRLPNEK